MLTDAQKYDRILAELARSGYDRQAGEPAEVIRWLRAKRRALDEMVFTPGGITAAGLQAYLVGPPDELVTFPPKSPANMRMLYTLVDSGAVIPAEWDDGTADPVETIRKRLARALDEIREHCGGLYDALHPLPRAVNGVFTYRPRRGFPRVVTTRGGSAADCGNTLANGCTVPPST